MIARAARFFGVGGLATVTHVVVALGCQAGFGLPDLIANLAGWLMAVTLSYFGHLQLTFGVSPAHSSQAPRFILVSVLGVTVSSVFVMLVAWAGGSFVFAMALVAVGVPLITFLLLHFWVFNERMSKRHLSPRDLLTPVATGVGFILVFWGQNIHHDVVWYHVAVRKWLEGAALYRDIIEVNPPLNFYLTLPVVRLADLTGFNDTNAQYIVLAGLTTLSLWLVARELRSMDGVTDRQRTWLLSGMGGVLTVLPLWDAGQREHLLILFMLPWLVARIGPADSGGWRMAALAAFAALGMCLKPFFVLFPIAILIVEAIRQCRIAPLFSVSARVFLITGLSYLAAVAFWHPTYLTDTLPMARLVYWAYGTEFAHVLRGAGAALWVLVLAAFWVVSRPGPPWGTPVFFLTMFAGVVVYFWQGTGFGYHSLPFVSFGAIGCVFACLDPRCRTVALVALVLLLLGAVHRGYYSNGAIKRVASVAAAEGPVDSLLVVTTHVSAGPIVAKEIGADWTSFYPAQWLVPGALGARARTDCAARPERCRTLKAIADRNRHDLIVSMAGERPDMIVFDKNSGYFDYPFFDWQAWLAVDPVYAEIMGGYTKVSEDDRLVYWTRQAP